MSWMPRRPWPSGSVLPTDAAVRAHGAAVGHGRDVVTDDALAGRRGLYACAQRGGELIGVSVVGIEELAQQTLGCVFPGHDLGVLIEVRRQVGLEGVAQRAH